ncbi:type 3 dihydrofolate reductase [Glaciecola sp. KUL10]|uniref:type 3 dihydrofolate reductase n=1 Tax=Glaciecola sp. (strain KUL10) TaxID=2161813 RepID=UPI000D788E78|nr:type 3 dihydrofolate reductase [Glaciecola sp. KUL10]GBL05114.1 dihydrofolate reductase type I, trimethoprim resistance [Glaciecola sp. KUL10]
MKISMIAAMAKNRVIGAKNDMPWHLPADLKHFKSVTMGKPIIMGRKTYESIGRALPGRVNVVITSNADAVFDGAVTVTSVEDAIVAAGDVDEVMIIGGGTIYQTCLASANRLYLTFIDLDVDGDTYFPDFEQASKWREVERTEYLADEKNPYNYEFVTFDRAL